MAYYLLTNPKDQTPVILRTPFNVDVEFWQLRDWFERDRQPGEDFLDWLYRRQKETNWDIVDFEVRDYPVPE